MPYEFSNTLTTVEQQTYLNGLREWELAANVKFVPHTNQANWILFCYNTNYLDYVSGGGYSPQIVTVSSLSRAQVCHEMGHSFGFTHENIRLDATNFVLVLTNNISNEPSNIYWFTIDPTSVTNGHYDYESVMHLGWDFDSTNINTATQQPKPPNFPRYQYRMGNFCLSPGDRAALAYLYPPATTLSNVVTNTADAGLGSLRAALYYVTDHPGSTVTFNIPTSDPGYSNGVYNIHLTGMLPPLVSNGMVIDGSTQPGFMSKPLIRIDASQIIPQTFTSDTVLIYSSSNQIRGVSFSGFDWNGMTLEYPDASNNTVSGCWIGVDTTGTNSAGNAFQGILDVNGASHNTFGGTNASARNVISGNSQYGIYVAGTNTTGNVIEGNYIGVDPSGSIQVSNDLSGIFIGGGTTGNMIGATNTAARNIISGNFQYGIWLSDTNTTKNTIQNNYLGTDVTGSNAIANGLSGIFIGYGTYSNTIGGTSTLARNVISGNTAYGIFMANTMGNTVLGNYIGVNVSGESALPNAASGIAVFSGAVSNFIGGARNVISGNEQYGIEMLGVGGVSNNYVFGNYIGTDAAGTNSFNNQQYGIGLVQGASGNIIGSASAGNLLSGNTAYNVLIRDPGSSGNVVLGNLIGTSAAGTTAIWTNGIGVGIFNGAAANVIGGTATGAGNLISGNTGYGIYISDLGTSNNIVLGNLIGTDTTGKNAIPNVNWGIGIWSDASSNVIGGTTGAARNVISGTTGNGYGITLGGANSNVVEGNYIGTDISGKSPIPNGFAGVAMYSGAVGNIIGGISAGAGNIIAFNNSPGVVMYDDATTNDSIRGNSIFSNGYLGINFNNAGVAPNHTGFMAGPNNLQNYPVITNAFGYAGSTIIQGSLNSLNNSAYSIDFYQNTSPDYSGYGQGQSYIGTTSVTTGASGNAFFAYTNNSGNDAGQYISAIATDVSGNSSEFSADVLATNAPAPSAQFTGQFHWSANGFIFNLTFTTNFSYHIQATTNLAANPVPWVNLTNFTATNVSLLFTDRTATSFRARYYRVVSP